MDLYIHFSIRLHGVMLKVIIINIILWVVTPSNLVEIYRFLGIYFLHFESRKLNLAVFSACKLLSFLFDRENGGTRFLRNIGILVSDFRTSQLKKVESQYSDILC
jgi:hypothetical protein